VAYPVSTPAAGSKPIGQKVAGSALAAGCLYIAGTYLPLVTSGGESIKASDSDGTVWLWVVPALVAIVAAVVGLTGKAVAGAIASGVVTGMAGLTSYELIVVYKAFDAPGVSKGAGFWALALAVVTSLGTAFPLLTARSAAEQRCEQVTSMLAAAAFVGIPLAILLPANGFSPLSDIEDGAIKLGLVVWALLAPALAIALTMSRRQSGVGFGAGVALGHLGFTMMVLQTDPGARMPALGLGHTALYHWTALAALGLAGGALAKTLMAPASPAAAAAQGQWAADPYGRHQYRLWDGTRWTANVSDHGVVGVDEPVVSQQVIPRDQWRPPNG
jgi:hypothetical protein